MRISVIIPSYNRSEPLLACLSALAVDFPADAEVIVVSDGGDRAKFPDLARFQDRLNLVVIHTENGGPAHARNVGLERVRAPLVAFLDDDCLTEPGWIESIAAAVNGAPDLAVGGKTKNGLPDNICAVAAQLVLDLAERDQRNRNYPPFFYPSNNLAFPSTALRAIGGFDTRFRTSEDRDLCRRWLKSGHRLEKAPGAVLYHAPAMSLVDFWRKYVTYGEGAARFHEDPGESWNQTFAYHFRIPGLVLQEFREGSYRHPFRLALMMVFWEFANLVGFIKGRFHQRGSGTAP